MKLYFPGINFLRGFAALFVCFYHFTNYTDINGTVLPEGDWLAKLGLYGVQGVFIFFVISGFVIPLSLSNEKFELKSFHRFIGRRWIRIEIPYLGSILLYLAISFAFSVHNQTPFVVEIECLLHHLFYTVAFTDYEWYNPIYWTLAIEFQFYIIIGLIYPLLISENKYLQVGILLIFGFSALLLDDHRSITYYSPIFVQGMLLFLIKRHLLYVPAARLLILLFACVTVYVHGWTIAVFSMATVLSISYFHVDKRIFNRFGDISYSLYLIHGAIGGSFLYFTARHFDSYGVKLLLILAAIMLSLVSAYVYWRLIEAPSKKLSKKVKL